jgi:hypothetical protein
MVLRVQAPVSQKTRAKVRRVALATCVAQASVALPVFASDTLCGRDEPVSPCFDADALVLPLGAARFATVPSPRALGEGRFAAVLGAGLARDPVTLIAPSPHPDGREVPVVDWTSSATLGFSFGVLRRLDAGVALPLVVYQTGTGVEGVTSQSAPPIQANAVRDPRLTVAYQFLGSNAESGSAAGARLELALPLGDSAALAGAGSPTLAPGLTAEHQLGRFTFAGDLSLRLRRSVRFANVERGSEIALGVAASVVVLNRPLLATGAELSLRPNLVGAASNDPHATVDLPAEWLVGLRLKPCGRDDPWSLITAGGAAIPLSSARGADGQREYFAGVTAPSFRAIAALRYESD